MKTVHPPHRRAVAALAPTLMVLASPALAQAIQTTTAPPPPVAGSTAEPAAAPAPAPAQQAAPQMGPSAPVVQQNIPQQRTAEEATQESTAAPDRQPARATRSAPAREASVTRASAPQQASRAAPAAKTPEPTAPAPAAKAPETPAPAPAPVAQTPADQTASDAQPQAAPAAQTATDTTQQTTDNGTAGYWPWIAAGVVAILAIIGFAALRRRRTDEVVVQERPLVEPAYVEPVAAAPLVTEPAPLPTDRIAPVAAAPIVTEEPRYLTPEPVAQDRALPMADRTRETVEPVAPVAALDGEAPVAAPETAEIVAPAAEDVAALTAGDPPIADRPWLEMAMRPVRAGTNADEAVVELELTIGNAGSVTAENVRIATFMFAGDPDPSEVERLLLDRDAAAVPPVQVAAGEGKTLEATLALPREMLDGEVSPVIVADARYPLPGGGEGHTSAQFRIGVRQEDGSISPIRIGKPHMTETVDAELYGTPERV